MNFIFSTGSLYTYSLARCFALAVAAGFDGIELMVDPRWDTRQPEHIHALTAQYGLPILAVHSPFSGVAGWPEEEAGRIHFSARLAENVGAPVVIHHLPARVDMVRVSLGPQRFSFPLPGINGQEEYANWLEDGYAQLQAATTVKLCIENMPARTVWGRRLNAHYWNTPDALSRFPHITMDTTHLGTWGMDPLAAYERWGEQIGHVHLSNFDGREHRLPEAGVLRLDRLLARLARDHYAGAISLELHPDAVGAGLDDDVIIARLAASLQQCRLWTDAGR